MKAGALLRLPGFEAARLAYWLGASPPRRDLIEVTETPQGWPVYAQVRRGGWVDVWAQDGEESYALGRFPLAEPAMILGAIEPACEEPPGDLAEPIRNDPGAFLG